MAVNSKADKTSGHKVSRVSVPSLPASPALSRPQYSQAAPSPGAVLGAAGTKALMFRAKKELAPLEDPTQSIAD